MKPIKFAVLSALIFASAPAFAAKGVMGTWQIVSINSGTTSIVGTLTFEPSKATMTTVCKVGSDTKTVAVSSPATFTATQIVMTQRQNQSVQVGSGAQQMECDADIDAWTIDYSVSADDAVLTMSIDGEPQTFPRVN